MGAGSLTAVFCLQVICSFLLRKKEPSSSSWWRGGERLSAGAIIGERGQDPGRAAL